MGVVGVESSVSHTIVEVGHGRQKARLRGASSRQCAVNKTFEKVIESRGAPACAPPLREGGLADHWSL
jgi:hypothetical protein